LLDLADVVFVIMLQTAASSLGLQIQLLFTEAAAISGWHRSLRLITLFKTEHEVAKSLAK
jgi:hypothetical protein